MAPSLTEVRDIQLQLTTHLSTPKGWKAELAWLVDLQRTVYPHKWSPVSYRSSTGQEKFTDQRPTFYHCATQSTNRCLRISITALGRKVAPFTRTPVGRCGHTTRRQRTGRSINKSGKLNMGRGILAHGAPVAKRRDERMPPRSKGRRRHAAKQRRESESRP